MSKQLEDAKMIMESIAAGIFEKQPSKNYLVEYHPKDKLFEKFYEFMNRTAHMKSKNKVGTKKEEYKIAKDMGLFTMALDEVIELTKKFMFIGPNNTNKKIMIEKFEEIRAKYTQSPEGK